MSRIPSESLVYAQIVGRHPFRAEMSFENLSAILPADRSKLGHAPDGTFNIVNNKPRQPMSHDLRH